MRQNKVELDNKTQGSFYQEVLVFCPIQKYWMIDVGSPYKKLGLLTQKIESTAFTTFNFNPFNITDNFNETMSDVAGAGMSFTASYLKEMEAKHAAKSN